MKNREIIEKIIELVPPGRWEINVDGMRLKIVKCLKVEIPIGPKSEVRQPEPEKIITITSPQIGYFFTAIKIGNQVKKGEKIGYIEMRILNLKEEIFSLNNGKIKEIFVENGDVVQFGQPLFKIEAYE